MPSTRFTLATARTPTWNLGYHEVDPTRLKFADGKLTGTLVMFIHQNGWMPWGGGKHIQHDGLPIKFEVNAELKNNELTGRYTASLGGELKGLHYSPGGHIPVLAVIPETKFEGRIGGRGGKLVVGRYTARGDLGEQVGAVDGIEINISET